MTLAQGYTPFGVLLWQEGSGASGYGYTGEREDSDIKLVFLRARFYDSYLGRFISKDPWAGNLRRPGTLNPYVYAMNNPLSFVDPSGHQGKTPWDRLIELVTGVKVAVKTIWMSMEERGQKEFEHYRDLPPPSEILEGPFRVGPVGPYNRLESRGQAWGIVKDWYNEKWVKVKVFGPDNSLTQDIMYDIGTKEFRRYWAERVLATVFAAAYPRRERGRQLLGKTPQNNSDILSGADL